MAVEGRNSDAFKCRDGMTYLLKFVGRDLCVDHTKPTLPHLSSIPQRRSGQSEAGKSDLTPNFQWSLVRFACLYKETFKGLTTALLGANPPITGEMIQAKRHQAAGKVIKISQKSRSGVLYSTEHLQLNFYNNFYSWKWARAALARHCLNIEHKQ